LTLTLKNAGQANALKNAVQAGQANAGQGTRAGGCKDFQLFLGGLGVLA
jgi:hypothetical protein